MSDPVEFSSSQNHEDAGFFGSVVGGAYLLLAIPAWLWHLYVEYLWNWDEHPWIISAAATFKLVAILVITPFAMLSMLDVGAYVIARTLGVVETTRASTSDIKHAPATYPDSDGSESEMVHVETPPVRVDDADVADATARDVRNVSSAPEVDVTAASPSSARTSPTKSRLKSRFDVGLTIPIPQTRYTHFGKAMQGGDGPEAEACFFSPSDERQLELSGALLSSPTPSRQASPPHERRPRVQPLNVERLPLCDVAPSASSDASSTADSEPFTVLDSSDLNRDIGPEGADSPSNTMENLRRGAGRNDDGMDAL
ncbi:uncharacterized protein FOMMEDRAFT_156239 [Fomitiporia mediterranea MF3/22]|uniref:uncharacterized protein n=1 Tax=Fomitiporia mediterranea (strain MF3/22) TaxID=694068 RepID=UPI0004407A9B|nr:uncharacterized protein FOMMEDRAFT_156239 [Fomitiporia mediterranea MF3/22]EJD02877.1 hypothetical protein FOMMEDRAFT_156239 [Fomitiporia mediterranea MF3/22]